MPIDLDEIPCDDSAAFLAMHICNFRHTELKFDCINLSQNTEALKGQKNIQSSKKFAERLPSNFRRHCQQISHTGKITSGK